MSKPQFGATQSPDNHEQENTQCYNVDVAKFPENSISITSSDTMHPTLTPSGNVGLMSAMAAALLFCFFMDGGPATDVILAFAFTGLLAGVLQAGAIRNHRSEFLCATTAPQVRAMLTSSVQGKASVALFWLAGLVLVGLLVRGGEYANIQTVIGAYAAFSLGREGATMPALFELAKAGETR